MELLREDLHRIVLHLPSDLIRQTKLEPTTIVAGGFIRDLISGEKIRDIDVFGAIKEKLSMVATNLKVGRNGRLHYTNNAITLLSPSRMPIQFITRWLYLSSADILASFDFTVCQVLVRWNNLDSKWIGECSETFYSDLASRRLRYTNPVREEEAGGSMLRVIKFVEKGYHISPESLGKVIGRLVSKVDFERLENGRTDVGSVITGLLREVDPLKIVDGVELRDDHAEVQM